MFERYDARIYYTFQRDFEFASFTHFSYFLLKCNCNRKCHISRVLKLHLETRHPVWIVAAHNEQLTQLLVHFCLYLCRAAQR